MTNNFSENVILYMKSSIFLKRIEKVSLLSHVYEYLSHQFRFSHFLLCIINKKNVLPTYQITIYLIFTFITILEILLLSPYWVYTQYGDKSLISDYGVGRTDSTIAIEPRSKDRVRNVFECEQNKFKSGKELLNPTTYLKTYQTYFK